MSTSEPTTQQPPTINFILSFLLVGLAWGFTTPFIRRAVKDRAAAAAADAAASSTSSAKRHDEADNKANLTLPKRVRGLIANGLAAAIDLLRNPRYAIPLVLNLSGSVWFFLLVGKAELSLTVPIVNTVAFLFTVLGEWWVEGKVISRNTMLGMMLSVAGIALCVHSKNA